MSDAVPAPAARLEELTSLYERRAYVAWNVALRAALAEDRAAAAARRAFLAQVTAPDESRVPGDAARLAAQEAGAVDPRDIEEPVLAATARLAPAQRAALALSELADASSDQVAAALGIEPRTERSLRERAYQELGTLLGQSAADAQTAYAELPWVEPPEELWAELYPQLHGAVTQHARAAAQLEAAPQVAERSRKPLAGLWRPPRLALVGIAVLAVAGVAWAASGGGGSSGGEDDPAGYPSTPQGSGGGAYPAGGGAGRAETNLTPEELDRLRQKEIADLARFTRQKADKRLPPRKRRRAARKVSKITRLAQERERAAERRELAVRQQLAREREARIRERRRRQEAAAEDSQPAPDRQQPSPTDEPSRTERPTRNKPDGDREGGRDDEDGGSAECLYNPDSGAYICPE
jgi:hypothetical protein